MENVVLNGRRLKKRPLGTGKEKGGPQEIILVKFKAIVNTRERKREREV